jgi:hypothetical protein
LAIGRDKEADTTITIVGQSGSGKTNMLASLLFNSNAYEDLKEGEDPVKDPAFKSRGEDSDRQDTEVLRRQFERMLFGRDYAEGGATEAVRRYRCYLEYTSAEDTGAGWLRKLSSKSEPTPIRIDFDIVDGRGGDVAPDGHESELDEGTKSRRQVYRDALDRSSAAVICMPVQDAEYRNRTVRNFLDELARMKEAKRRDPTLPRLERIAICFTKYEAEFLSYGPGAYGLASDARAFRQRMRDHPNLRMFGDLVESNTGEDAIDLRFFPVSSYGFLSQGGSANFYDYPYARGLKTRAVDPVDDYGNPNLEGYQMHFPVQVKEATATKLWWPYNVAPPFFFALTGRVTGPMALLPHEIGFGGSDQDG